MIRLPPRSRPGAGAVPAETEIKASGFGREGGTEGIGEYLETKYLGLAV